MNKVSFFLREAWNEFRAGMSNGVAVLIFLGLTAYILVVLSSAGSLADMGAGDVPRNSAGVVYLFTTGDTFFLFFAWAWLFAQPIVRDREAHLHEIVFTAPISLRTLLAARFTGALGVAVVIGASQVFGFMLAPLMEPLGLVPPGSMGPTPWVALGWSWLIFVVPTALGAGAIYFVAALMTRNAAGPFAASAILILAWMFAIIIVGESNVDPMIATLIDPSCFTDADRTVGEWTPAEKISAIYPLTEALWLNRIFWAGVPLAVLVYVMGRATRERLVLEREPKRAKEARGAGVGATAQLALPGAVSRPSWLSAIALETSWQVARLGRSRGFWIGMAAMVVFGVVGVFYHMLNAADGPFAPRPENTPPLLTNLLYLFTAFIAAALVGMVMRRDHREGFDEMFDAAPAPPYVRLIGRSFAVLFVAVILSLVPAASSIIAGAMLAPEAFDVVTPFLNQAIVVAPAMVELVALVVLAHALIRPSGPAYAASMLAVFMLIVNHELEIITYPPFELAIPAHIELSRLTGWGMLTEKISMTALYKGLIAALLIALAGIFFARGVDSRLARGARQIRQRAFSSLGGFAAVCAVALVGVYGLMKREYEAGGYHTRAHEIAEDGEWERRALQTVAAYSVGGGDVEINVVPSARRVDAVWRLNGVHTDGVALEAAIPDGFILHRVLIDGTPAEAEVVADGLNINVERCIESACNIEIAWSVEQRGWSAEGAVAWVSDNGVWLTAERVMPRLGFDIDRMLRVSVDREGAGLSADPAMPARDARLALGGVAPAGAWSWRIALDGREQTQGASDAPLDFGWVHAPRAVASERLGYTVLSDPSRVGVAEDVAADVADMQACVARRVGVTPAVRVIAQHPRGMGAEHCGYGVACNEDAGSVLAGDQMLLAEEPHWDVGATGVGRYLRQSSIARLLAQRAIVDGANVRQGDGGQWMQAGLGGAIGLLCVGDLNGPGALQALMQRGAERVNEAFAGASSPIGALSEARGNGWVLEYAPLASLGWVASADAATLQRIITRTRADGDVRLALTETLGARQADAFLGVPQASDVSIASAMGGYPSVMRWRWNDGGWRPSAGMDATNILRLSHQADVLIAEPANTQRSRAGVLVDGDAAFERAPGDNEES